MSENTSKTCYYVRFRGSVSGPYPGAKIREMHEAGKLSRYHQVSPDEITWISLAKSKLLEKPENMPKIKPTGQAPKTSLKLEKPPETPKPVPVAKAVPVQPPVARLLPSTNISPEAPVQSGYPQQPYPQAPYPQAPYPQAPYPPLPPGVSAPPRTSGMAIASFVLSLFGLGVPLGIIFGHVAASQIDRQPGQLSGRGFATAGLIIGYLSLFIGILYGISIS